MACRMGSVYDIQLWQGSSTSIIKAASVFDVLQRNYTRTYVRTHVQLRIARACGHILILAAASRPPMHALTFTFDVERRARGCRRRVCEQPTLNSTENSM